MADLATGEGKWTTGWRASVRRWLYQEHKQVVVFSRFALMRMLMTHLRAVNDDRTEFKLRVRELEAEVARLDRSRDDTRYLGPQECAVALGHDEADALLAMLEQANNAGMTPGPGLHVEAAQRAGFRIAAERFRNEDPYNRTSRIVAVVFRPNPENPTSKEGGTR